MAGQTRKSRQRDRILEVLRQTQSHPTAKWLFDRVRKQFPNLSLGTVYRNLGILVKQGLVSRLEFGSGLTGSRLPPCRTITLSARVAGE